MKSAACTQQKLISHSSGDIKSLSWCYCLARALLLCGSLAEDIIRKEKEREGTEKVGDSGS